MERSPSTDPAPLEPATLLEAIRYYSDLEIATKAFASPWCGSKENFYTPGRFALNGIPRWSVWSAHQAVRLVRS
ncbi:MAG: hypothetical protein ABSH47_03610 [Bryobacteraceae bacterium]|jgi:hypothetical protein